MSTVSVPLTAGLHESLFGSPRPGLLAFRSAQLITLALAILVAVRRAAQPSALLGAWLLGAIATVSIVLPMRLATFWDALPLVLRVLIWVRSRQASPSGRCCSPSSPCSRAGRGRAGGSRRR